MLPGRELRDQEARPNMQRSVTSLQEPANGLDHPECSDPPRGRSYVAECPELGTVSQGRTIEEAIANLKEATGLYLEEQEEPLSVAPAILTTFSIDTANAKSCLGFPVGA
jgi:predicted RNase H-like HicB family nuclease